MQSIHWIMMIDKITLHQPGDCSRDEHISSIHIPSVVWLNKI